MDFLSTLEHHLLDHSFSPFGVTIPVSFHVFLLLASATLLMCTLPIFARQWPVVPSGFRNFLETFVVFIRDEIVLPNTGEEGRPYLPYFLTVFFFIVTVNLIGLFPGSATATGNISVTAALALCTLFLINYAGIRRFGFVKHFKNLIPHGVPFWIAPVMFVIELMGLLTKSFALAIRLFANMTAGHIVILALLSLTFFLGKVWVGPIGSLMALGMYLLEVFVAFLQAYIFTLLSAIFVGASLHPH